MSIFLEYSFAPDEFDKLSRQNVAKFNATDLDYYWFRGNMFFRANDANFDAPWGWVTIIAFATQLFVIGVHVKDGEDRKLEFTESDAEIIFSRRGGNVTIKSNYSPDVAQVAYDELRNASIVFLSRVLDDLVTRLPALKSNSAFQERIQLLTELT